MERSGSRAKPDRADAGCKAIDDVVLASADLLRRVAARIAIAGLRIARARDAFADVRDQLDRVDARLGRLVVKLERHAASTARAKDRPPRRLKDITSNLRPELQIIWRAAPPNLDRSAAERPASFEGLVALRLRRLRAERGLSPEAVSAVLDITVRELEAYEKGARRVAAHALARFARLFGVPISAFFSGPGFNEA